MNFLVVLLTVHSSASKCFCLLIRIAFAWHLNDLVSRLLLLENLFLSNLVQVFVFLQFLCALERILGVQLVRHKLFWLQLLVGIWGTEASFRNQLGHIGVIHGVVILDMVAIPVYLGALDVHIVQRIADSQLAPFRYMRLTEDRVGA